MAYSLTYSYNSSSKSYSVTGYSGITTSDKVVIPATYNNGTNGEHPVTSISSSAFDQCTSLTSIIIPNSITIINAGAFIQCTSLTSVHIPNSVTRIYEDTFHFCSSLTSVHIPNSVTSIGPFAFANCSSLTSVTIPDSVTSIETNTFYDCTSLKQLILLPSTPPTMGLEAIPTTIQSIYVQQSSKAAYKAATNWSAFASKIVGNNIYLSFVRFNQKNKEYISKQVSKLSDKLYKHSVTLTNDSYVNVYQFGYYSSNPNLPETADELISEAMLLMNTVILNIVTMKAYYITSYSRTDKILHTRGVSASEELTLDLSSATIIGGNTTEL